MTMNSGNEGNNIAVGKRYQGSPIGKRASIASFSKEELNKLKAVDVDKDGVVATLDKEKYRSDPIKVEDLRNSLKSSLASKRGSMTSGELQFVQGMLQESLNENELETMDEVLKCDQTFFRQPSLLGEDDGDSSLLQEPGVVQSEEIRRLSSSASNTPSKMSRRASAPVCHLGSKKRQDYLEARKKQAAELSVKRAKVLWKKAALAAKTVSRLASVSKQLKQQQLSSLRNEVPIQEDVVAEEEEEEDEAEKASEAADKDTDKTEEGAEALPRVFLRKASINVYGGEGFEIGAEAFAAVMEEEEKKDATEKAPYSDDEEEEDSEEEGRDGSSKSFSSFDEFAQSPRKEGFRRASVNIYGGDGFEVACEDLFEQVYDENGRISYEDYDPWLFQETDKTGKRREFTILGTSHDDLECHPHVLSPVQMDRFQPYLPDSKKGESFWLKYSLVRDGASTISFLKQVRASPYTLLAMETIDGEVFGGFFANAWTVQHEYFGTGESFLWRMKHPRKIPGSSDEASPEGSLVEQIEKESDLEIFSSEVYYGNRFFQMCHQDKIACGGGSTSLPQDFGDDVGVFQPHQIGFGLRLGSHGSLLEGSSSASLTFRNPPLSKVHSDGSTFELVNLEAWGFTPCITEEEARTLEYKNMFFKRHASGPF